MKLTISLLIAAALTAATVQTESPFPPLTGEKLTGDRVTVPTDTQGKVTIIGMSYSKKAESTLKTWYQPMYDKFVLKRGMFDSQYDVHFFFVPMFTGGKKVAYGPAIKKMKESNRKDLYPHLLFYKGDLEPYKTELDMGEKNLPYLFVLDEVGNIVYQTKGLYSEKKMEKIEEILDERL